MPKRVKSALPSPAQKNPHFSAPGQNFKNWAGNLFGIDVRSLNAKLHPSSFQTEGRV